MYLTNLMRNSSAPSQFQLSRIFSSHKGNATRQTEAVKSDEKLLYLRVHALDDGSGEVGADATAVLDVQHCLHLVALLPRLSLCRNALRNGGYCDPWRMTLNPMNATARASDCTVLSDRILL